MTQEAVSGQGGRDSRPSTPQTASAARPARRATPGPGSRHPPPPLWCAAQSLIVFFDPDVKFGATSRSARPRAGALVGQYLQFRTWMGRSSGVEKAVASAVVTVVVSLTALSLTPTGSSDAQDTLAGASSGDGQAVDQGVDQTGTSGDGSTGAAGSTGGGTTGTGTTGTGSTGGTTGTAGAHDRHPVRRRGVHRRLDGRRHVRDRDGRRRHVRHHREHRCGRVDLRRVCRGHGRRSRRPGVQRRLRPGGHADDGQAHRRDAQPGRGHRQRRRRHQQS